MAAVGRKVRRVYEFHGQQMTAPLISQVTGLDVYQVRHRLWNGCPVDAPFGGHRVRFKYAGEEKTIAEWAIKWGISKKNAEQRLHYYVKTGRATRNREGVRRR